ncbi:MAG: chloride channel protein [Lachnospiraceae bacterium]|nr:chloride channel protein [Lachnospiraceae bacterium]
MNGKDKNSSVKESVNYFLGEIKQISHNFIKWMLLAIVTGGITGVISSAFGHALSMATSFRKEYPWLLFGLPLAGVIIVFLYKKFGKDDGGTNQVFSTVRARDEVPATAAPLIFVSTVLTHLTGGSAGREGAAIQLGGSIANQLGRWMKMDEEDTHVIVMCGMSAAFAALFGTPMAAAIFSLEVISVGVMYYTALMPCLIASLMAAGVAGALGIHAEHFFEGFVPSMTVIAGFKFGFVILVCSIVSILFCITLKLVGKAYGRWLKNKYIRIIAAAAIIIVLNLLLQTTDYMGAGTELIVQAVQFGKARPLDFFWKLVLTALTMKAGFRGGEIVPSFCIGATLGCVMGQLIGFEPRLCAACGMIAFFCGVTNCPITSMLIAFELFGFEGVSYYLIAVAVSYATSGYYGLYKDQTIVYSKYKAKYVNQKTR